MGRRSNRTCLVLVEETPGDVLHMFSVPFSFFCLSMCSVSCPLLRTTTGVKCVGYALSRVDNLQHL
jgi:hypothetical protein